MPGREADVLIFGAHEDHEQCKTNSLDGQLDSDAATTIASFPDGADQHTQQQHAKNVIEDRRS